MARTLSTLLQTETAKAVTTPFYLVRIEWSPSVVSYLSTGGTVSYDSQTWTGGRVTVEEIRSLIGGSLEGRISFAYTDDAAGAYALNYDLSAAEVKVWLLYGAGPYTAGDALQVFHGVMDGCDITATRVTFGLVSHGRRREMGPRVILAPPLCNHLPPPGLRIVWGGEIIELDRR